MHLDQGLPYVIHIKDFIFSRASLDHVNSYFPMLRQWVLLNIWTYVLKKKYPTSHKVLHLGL